MKQKETEYISIWLNPNSKDRRQFRCCNCGKIAFEYTGSVRGIVIGDNNEEYPQVVQCKGTVDKVDITGARYSDRCHTKYVIS